MAGGTHCIIQLCWEIRFIGQTPTHFFPKNPAGYSRHKYSNRQYIAQSLNNSKVVKQTVVYSVIWTFFKKKKAPNAFHSYVYINHSLLKSLCFIYGPLFPLAPVRYINSNWRTIYSVLRTNRLDRNLYLLNWVWWCLFVSSFSQAWNLDSQRLFIILFIYKTNKTLWLLWTVNIMSVIDQKGLLQFANTGCQDRV